MRKMENKENIQGLLYEHKLVLGTVKREDSENFGKEFIRGSVSIATDDACLNIVKVDYSYEPPIHKKSGKTNKNFAILKKIIDEGKTVLEEGAEAATKIKVDSSLWVNDFVDNGTKEIVAAKQNSGGFISIPDKLVDEKDRSTFKVDMFINSVKRIDADETKGIMEDYLLVNGFVFNFRNNIAPVSLTVRSIGGISYFEGLDPSNAAPVLTNVWGKMVTHSSVSTAAAEESAFGEEYVDTSERKFREWLITGTAKMPYELGEGVLTVEELTTAMADREIHLADVRQKDAEYQASKAATQGADITAPATVATAAPAAGGFSF